MKVVASTAALRVYLGISALLPLGGQAEIMSCE
ncbi:hypothetical protein ACVWWZ_001198 [Thermostichus sp. OS-CIW-39]